MARPVTSDIKTKRKRTYHLSAENIRLMERCHIDVEHKLRNRVDVTKFVNSLIAVGLDHMDEIINRLLPEDSGKGEQ